LHLDCLCWWDLHCLVPAKRGRESSPLIHAGAQFGMARRQAGQHELANGFRIPPQTWAQPLRRRIPPGGWSLGLGSWSEFNRLTGARECLSCESRPPRQDLDLLHVTLQFISRYRRPADCAALNRPAMHMLLLALHKAMAMLSLLQLTSSSCALASRAANCAALALQDRAPTARLLCYQNGIW